MAGIVEHHVFDTDIYIGREINNITLMELIGRGAMGAVFIGYQKSLKRKVAVKLFPKQAENAGNYRIHFREEAEIVAVLNHPNIVQVIDMGETSEFLFIVMQLVAGEDLRSMIHRHQLHPVPSKRLIDLQKVLGIMLPVLDALSYAHEEGVIHQDIKPGNILIEERTGRIYLADFGIARSAMNEEGDEPAMIMGTPMYIAPEQICEEQSDPRSDIYSAGTVLYEAIAGKLPFQITTVEALINLKLNSPETLYTMPPSRCCRRIDTELEKIILKAIAPRKEERYQNCRSFYHGLSAYCKNRFGGESV
ncbi:MAG: serine/threonine protein kinase [Chitinispirillaceae bacterium]|nr:serine/threonine protein kinase [Chitinispirillaceae bacterium]